MDSLSRSRTKVRERRAELKKGLEEIGKRLRPTEMAENILTLFDAEQGFISRMASAIRQNPLAATALLAGAGWLYKQGNDGRRPRKRHAKVTPITKETHP